MSEQEEQSRQETPKQEKAREAKEERARAAEEKEAPLAPEAQAITPGTVITAATTIDALFTALYATRSADLVAAGVPTYSWARDNMIIAQWPTLQVGASPAVPNYSAMFCTFHARSDLSRGSSIAQ